MARSQRAMHAFLIITFLLISNSYSRAQDELELRLHLDKGDKYLCVMDMTRSVTQTVEGEQQSLNQALTVNWLYEVRGVSDDSSFNLKLTYKRIRISQDLGFQRSEYDSDNPPSYIEPSMRGYSALINASLEVKVDGRGKVLEMTGADELVDRIISDLQIPDSPRKNQIISDIRNQFGENAIRGSIQQITSFYPPGPVSVANEWESEDAGEPGIPMSITNRYTLVDFGKGVANIDLQSEISSDSSKDIIDVGNVSIAYDISGRQDGVIEVDELSGLPIKSDIQMEFEGSVTSMGIADQDSRSWPIKSSGRVIITFEKE